MLIVNRYVHCENFAVLEKSVGPSWAEIQKLLYHRKAEKMWPENRGLHDQHP